MVIHLIHHPVSAKKFVEPIVKLLNSHGVEAELWIENREEFKDFISAIDCPKSFAKFDLSLNLFSVLVRLVRLLKRFVRLRPTANTCSSDTRGFYTPVRSAARTGSHSYLSQRWNSISGVSGAFARPGQGQQRNFSLLRRTGRHLPQ